LLLQICTAPLPSVRTSAPWLPATVDVWFQRACAREPQDRFASAQEFSDALQTAAGVTMNSRGSTLPVTPSDSLPETPSGNAGGGLQVLATSGTSSGVSKSGEDIIPPRRGKLWLGITAAAVLLVGGLVGATVVFLGRGAHAPAHPAASAAPATLSAPPVAETTAAPRESAPPEAASPEPATSHENVAAPTPSAAPRMPAHATPRPARPPPPTPSGAVDLGY
jgi:serine/threonine-protein kinase